MVEKNQFRETERAAAATIYIHLSYLAIIQYNKQRKEKTKKSVING